MKQEETSKQQVISLSLAERGQILDTLGSDGGFAELAVRMGYTRVRLRETIEQTDGVLEAISDMQARLSEPDEVWETKFRPKWRLAIEKSVAAGQATVITLAGREFDLFGSRASRSGSNGSSEIPVGEERLVRGLPISVLERYSKRQIAQWWWFDVREATPHPADRLLPFKAPETFEDALWELVDYHLNEEAKQTEGGMKPEVSDAIGLNNVSLRAEALRAAEEALHEVRPGDKELSPELFGLHVNRHQTERAPENITGNPGSGKADGTSETHPPESG